ncbi:hypothetical protein PF005_g14454 [Phytophthora fragariae]|uniref:Uncharacterized protein n=1 Tax=Phytophthora fragariae TaxID=53985 RepID=A0A6A4D611_9STRA|nr:hypothetical protein PF003_g22831 [Phytophthora fragariae]KAE8934189.1 hypothetical protein PF009_g15828 [Phytophthora fragariae]KAE9002392.1 hypothetical protein PF011_g13336 [Phytophthora fragariae]KAE9102316.1 hypothetical protein PF007_g14805 [Phytophthora fragariae]KAE9113870.1 hypothetical protein PF010_g9913 [Phytophthora fragariae]
MVASADPPGTVALLALAITPPCELCTCISSLCYLSILYYFQYHRFHNCTRKPSVLRLYSLEILFARLKKIFASALAGHVNACASLPATTHASASIAIPLSSLPLQVVN